MALLLVIGAALQALGCERRVPAKRPPVAAVPKVPALKVASLGTPSALLDPPPGDPDKLPFDLPLDKGYGIEGAWSGPNQVKGTRQFERIGNFTVKRAGNAEVDPKEIASLLGKWIASSGVQSTESGGAGALERSVGYGTAQTIGTIRTTVRPDAPAAEVTFHIEIREQPR